MLRLIASAVLAAAVIVPAAGAAYADVKAVGRYKDWTVYTETVGRDTICYAAVTPNDKAPKNGDHGEVTFYVASWKSGSAANQPSLKVGYDLRSDIAPVAVVGSDRFGMYVSGKEAFVPDDRERSLIDAVKKGTELRIEAASKKEARTAYHFSLKGSSDAIDKARSLCR
jgi:hypothetical protein